MVKTSQLVGLPVVTTGEGSIYGRVRDVSLAVNRKSVWGIMVERNNLMRTSRWIPYEGILLVGDVSRAGIYTALIREQTPLSSIDYELIREKPQLAAFSRAERAHMLGGVQA